MNLLLESTSSWYVRSVSVKFETLAVTPSVHPYDVGRPIWGEPLRVHAEDLAGYLNENILDNDELTGYDILEALASLGITLVEDPIADSTLTYYESLPKPDAGS